MSKNTGNLNDGSDSPALARQDLYDMATDMGYRSTGNVSPISTTGGNNKIVKTDSNGNAVLTGGMTAGRDSTINGMTVGRGAGDAANNTAIGYHSLYSNTTGNYSTANGYLALSDNTTGNTNTANGYLALSNNTTYSNCSGLGYNAQVTGENQVQLGNSLTRTYAYGAVLDRSDERDKEDIVDTEFGLEFINKLRPVQFKWDYREDYREDGQAFNKIVKDGSKKRNRFHQGFIAQEVKVLTDELDTDFGGYIDNLIANGEDVKALGYEEFIAPMVRAIQELSAKIVELETANDNL